jgi:Putative esterase
VPAWTAAGSSKGAVWAIAAAQRRPDVFPRVLALSPGVPPRRVSGPARAAGVRHYLAAGLLEPPFLRATREWAQRLRRAGFDVRLEVVHGGYDLWWREHLVTGLAYLDQTSSRPRQSETSLAGGAPASSRLDFVAAEAQVRLTVLDALWWSRRWGQGLGPGPPP